MEGTVRPSPFFCGLHIYGMGDAKIIKRAFNAGEISRRAKWRNDTEKHAYSCERLENFYVSPLGSIYRREGTRFLASLGTDERADSVRLVPFEYNRNFSRIIALHSVDGGKNTSTSGAFELPGIFTICVTIPEGFNKTGEILKKGTLSLTRAADGTVVVSSGQAVASFNISSQLHKLAFVFDGDFLKIYCDCVLLSGYPVEFTGSFRESSSLKIFQVPECSDIYEIKIFNFDISRDNPHYSLQDYQDGEAAGAKIEAFPEWKDSDDIVGYDCKYNIVLNTPEIGPVYPTYGWTQTKTKVSPQQEVSYSNSNICINAASLVDTRNSIKQKVPYDFSGHIVPGTEAYENWLATEAQYKSLTSDIAALQEAIANSNDPVEIEQLQSQLRMKIQERGDAMLGLKQIYGIVYCSPEWSSAQWTAFLEANLDRYESEDALFLACLNREYTWKLPDTEIISVPFSVKAGAKIEFSSVVDASNTVLELKDAGGELHPLDFGAQSYSSDIVELVFTMKHQNGLDPFYEGAFVLKASYEEIAVQYEFEADKVVFFDVYGIDGNALVKNAESPIPVGALQEFHYKQVGGDIYIAHSSLPPQKLSMDASGEFKWSNATSFYPSVNSPESGVVIACGDSGSTDEIDPGELYPSGTAIPIAANNPFFTADMVGSQLKIEYADKAAYTYKWKFNSTGAVSAWFPAYGKVTVTPEGGIWDGILILEESVDDGKTWNEIGRTTSVQGSSNTPLEREVYNVKSLIRARMLSQNKVEDTQSSVVDANTEGCFFNISLDCRASVWCEIVAVNSGTLATAKILNPCRQKFVSTSVYKSAWGSAFGYPRTVEIHEERLCFAGTSNQPATIWLSQTNNWDNFRSVSNLDTDPLAYTLASDDGEPISWLVSRSDLMVGMGSSEWSFGSRDATQALTASIVHASSQSDDGAEYVMPAKAGGMVVFVRRGNMALAGISYDFASDAYNAISLTTMNPDLLASGVVCIFNQLSPDNKIYAVCKDGTVAVFTYDKENNVAAWGRFLFGEGAISGCAVSSGKFKSVFLIVKRNGYLCLERLDPNEQGTDNWLDCAPISESAVVPEGLETSVMYESLAKTTPLFLEGNVRILEVKLYLLNSFGGKFRVVGFDANGDAAGDEWRNILPKEEEFPLPLAPRDYRYAGAVDTGYLEEAAIEVSASDAAPFELTAIGINAKG